MRKPTTKQKIWLDKHSQKIARQHLKKRRIKKFHSHGYYMFRAPDELSLYKNPNETILYFHRVIKQSKQIEFDKTIYLNLQDTSLVTIDAIMYMLAIIKNLKIKNTLRIKYTGNSPLEGDARQVFLESGFLNHVYSTSLKPISCDNEKIQIISGLSVEGESAAKVCEFVIDKLPQDLLYKSRILYRSIIELMTNTNQHAYDEEKHKLMNHHWYMYTENTDNKINFVFLDTGLGIPYTVLKKIPEKIRAKLNMQNDSKLIYSALKGEGRSETGEVNRGRGLPVILDSSVKRELEDLVVISGRGIFTMDDNNHVKLINLEEKFEGTLFMWSFTKEREAV